MREIRFWFALCAALVCFASAGYAQPPSLKEKLKEFVVCNPGCHEEYSGSFQIKFSQSGLDPQVFATFTADTVFELELGNFSFQGTLGSDPNYAVGDTSVTFARIAAVAPGVVKRSLLMKVSWKGDTLRIQAKGITPLEDSPAAVARAGLDLFPIALSASYAFENNSSPVLSSTWTNREYPSVTKRTTKTYGMSVFELDSIKVTGPLPLEN